MGIEGKQWVKSKVTKRRESLERACEEHEAAKSELVEIIDEIQIQELIEWLYDFLRTVIILERGRIQKLFSMSEGGTELAVEASIKTLQRTAREKTRLFIRNNQLTVREEIGNTFADTYTNVFVAYCRLKLATGRNPVRE